MYEVKCFRINLIPNGPLTISTRCFCIWLSPVSVAFSTVYWILLWITLIASWHLIWNAFFCAKIYDLLYFFIGHALHLDSSRVTKQSKVKAMHHFSLSAVVIYIEVMRLMNEGSMRLTLNCRSNPHWEGNREQ